MCFFDSYSPVSSLSKATCIIKDFLEQKSVTRFRPYDVLDLLQPLVTGEPQTKSKSAQQVRHSVKKAFVFEKKMDTRIFRRRMYCRDLPQQT